MIPTNAAPLYRRAFAIHDELSQEQISLIGNWRTTVLPSRARKPAFARLDKERTIETLKAQAGPSPFLTRSREGREGEHR